MLTPKLQRLADAKAKVEELERALSAEREAVLRRLHTEVGYSTREELIEALRSVGGGGAAAGRGGRRGPGRPGRPGRPPKKTASGRKKRAVITPELRDSIIAAVKSGATGQAVAEKFNVSLPTVQNIKNAAGLTKKRKKGK